MKRTVLLALLVTSAGIVNAQQGVIARQHQGNSTFFYVTSFIGAEIQSAINACDPSGGDTLILPGGTFTLTGSTDLLIDRPIVVIGAGYLSASNPVTGSTVIGGTNDVDLVLSAAGSSFFGLDFDMGGAGVVFANSGTMNVSFSRCDFGTVFLGTTGAGSVNSQIHFRECQIGNMSGYDATSVTIDNCVFKGSSPWIQGFSSGGLTMRNSVVHNWTNANNENCYYYNNVFLRNNAGGTVSETSSFFDNLFVVLSGSAMSPTTTLAFLGNATQVGLTGVFSNVTSLSTFALAFDYHTPLGSPAIALNAGIYVGPSPWKYGAIPFNPHWDLLNTPGVTIDGLLPGVQIQATAQPN